MCKIGPIPLGNIPDLQSKLHKRTIWIILFMYVYICTLFVSIILTSIHNTHTQFCPIKLTNTFNNLGHRHRGIRTSTKNHVFLSVPKLPNKSIFFTFRQVEAQSDSSSRSQSKKVHFTLKPFNAFLVSITDRSKYDLFSI